MMDPQQLQHRFVPLNDDSGGNDPLMVPQQQQQQQQPGTGTTTARISEKQFPKKQRCRLGGSQQYLLRCSIQTRRLTTVYN